MATKALTHVAQRASLDHVSITRAPKHVRGWRELLTSEDADAIWHRLSELVRSTLPESQYDISTVAQQLFLHLLTSDRLSLYIDRNYSDEQIKEDLIALCRC